MRILQISSAKNIGGGEKHLLDLIRCLAAKGHEVFLAAPPDSPLRESVTDQKGITFLPVHLGSALNIFAAVRLAKLIRENNIEIAHAHLARDYVPAALGVRFAPRAKLVLTRHVLFPMKGLQRFALANVARVIAVSRAVERRLLEQNIFPPRKIVTIHNGIDLKHFTAVSEREDFRSAYNIPSNAFLFAAVGELKKLKGQEDLILAAEFVLKSYNDIYFVIVGKDNSGGEYASYLRRMADAAGAGDRFIWIDWLEDTAPLLHALNAFISPSHSESFGLAILEAIAAGCPVIATKTEGAMELLDPEQLVEIGRPELLGAFFHLLRSSDLGDKFRHAQQNRGLEKFGLKKMVDKTEELYLELQRSA